MFLRREIEIKVKVVGYRWWLVVKLVNVVVVGVSVVVMILMVVRIVLKDRVVVVVVYLMV